MSTLTLPREAIVWCLESFRGIHLSRNKYQAAIMANGKRMYLGYFNQIEDAIAARAAAERQYHGEYAACQQ